MIKINTNLTGNPLLGEKLPVATNIGNVQYMLTLVD